MPRKRKTIHNNMDRLTTMEQLEKILPVPLTRGVVIILSGGMDSAVALQFLKRHVNTIVALTFDYGQRHKIEIQYARRQCEKLGVEHIIINLSSLGNHLKSSQTDYEPIEVPEGHYTAENMKATVVPNRNMIMLSIAAGICHSLDYEHICFAAHSGDHAIYPDCRGIFVDHLQTAIWMAFEEEQGPNIYTPFINVDKATIALHGHNIEVLFEDTWSCYKGERGNIGEHCGKCGTCVERKEAFEVAGVPDPTLWFEDENEDEDEDEDEDDNEYYDDDDDEDDDDD